MDPEFHARLRGERLSTAEVIYWIPDHPHLLQSFTWQTLDRAPDFPRIRRFLEHWRTEIEAMIHSVRVSAQGVILPPRIALSTEFEIDRP